MSEKKMGLVQNVMIGPWYGEVYDLVLTDARFLLIHVGSIKMRSAMRDRKPDEFQRDSADSLAARDGSISIPYRSVQRIRTVPGLQRGMHYLILSYSDAGGKKRRLKVLYIETESTRVFQVETVDINKEKYTPIALSFHEGMSILLAKSIPQSAIQTG